MTIGLCFKEYTFYKLFFFEPFLKVVYMISILMPIYNGIEFIEESVSSILNQTYHENQSIQENFFLRK